MSITYYCHDIKHLANALANVDSEITELELVMKILRGLLSSYHSIVNVVKNTKPFPSFLEAKNMLLLRETREENDDQMLEQPHPTITALYSTT